MVACCAQNVEDAGAQERMVQRLRCCHFVDYDEQLKVRVLLTSKTSWQESNEVLNGLLGGQIYCAL